MSTLSNLKTKSSLYDLDKKLMLKNKKINKIKKALLNLEKNEVASFNPLKVKVYKEEKNDLKNVNKIKIPVVTFQSYFEDFKKNTEFIKEIEYGPIIPSNVDLDKTEQVDSSDLANSD